jgi:hypothetical protein
VPEDVLERVDKAAKANGVSRTRLLLEPYWKPTRPTETKLEKAQRDLLMQSKCQHPRSAEVKTGYMVMCGLCRTKLR